MSQLNLFAHGAVQVAQALSLQAPVESVRPETEAAAVESPSEKPWRPLLVEDTSGPFIVTLTGYRSVIPWGSEPDEDPTSSVLLVDGHSIVEQAARAPKLRERITRAGEPCGIVHGFTRSLIRMLQQFRPSHVGVFFDGPGYSARRAIFPEYKAKATDEHWIQIEACEDIAEALGCFSGSRLVVGEERADVEACDAIAAAVAATPENWPVVVATTDTRLAQIAQRDNARLTFWQSGEQITESAATRCRKKLHVEPEQVSDYLAIVGNVRAGVPGVRGLGDVAATTLLREFGSLECIVAVATASDGIKRLEQLADLRGAERVAKCIREGLDDLLLSFRLVELSRELPEIMPFESCMSWLHRRDVDQPSLARLYSEYEVPEQTARLAV